MVSVWNKHNAHQSLLFLKWNNNINSQKGFFWFWARHNPYRPIIYLASFTWCVELHFESQLKKYKKNWLACAQTRPKPKLSGAIWLLLSSDITIMLAVLLLVWYFSFLKIFNHYKLFRIVIQKDTSLLIKKTRWQHHNYIGHNCWTVRSRQQVILLGHTTVLGKGFLFVHYTYPDVRLKLEPIKGNIIVVPDILLSFQLTHVVWKRGTRDFGAPLIKISFFGPLCSPWKIINFDLLGGSNRWSLTIWQL